MLGLFTQLGCAGRARAARRCSTSAASPRRAAPAAARGRLPAREQEPDRGGARSLVVLAFRTGRIAGLDLLRDAACAGAPAVRGGRRMNLTPEQQALGPPQLPEGPRRHAGAGRAGRRRGHSRARARRPGAGRLHRRRRPGPRAARADATRRFAEVRGALRHQPRLSSRRGRGPREASKPPGPRTTRTGRRCSQKEDIEAVVIAPPLWTHADIAVGCLEAGKHVLCEKMMAWDVAGCQRMRDGRAEDRRVLEIGYQRFYNPRLPGRLRGHRQARACSATCTTRASRGTATGTGAARRAALARLRPLALGLPDLRAPDQLAALLEVLARACSPSWPATR